MVVAIMDGVDWFCLGFLQTLGVYASAWGSSGEWRWWIGGVLGTLDENVRNGCGYWCRRCDAPVCGGWMVEVLDCVFRCLDLAC